MSKITKQIKYIPDSLRFENFYRVSMDDFIDIFQRQKDPQLLEKKTIEIKPAEQLPLLETCGHPLIIETNGLSFQITNDEIEKTAYRLLEIFRNPIVIPELLKDLDNELGVAMKKNGIPFSKNELPEFIIAGQTHYIPGPPPAHYHPKKKDRLLNTILLGHERENGINLEEDSPKFLGFIENNLANHFVATGHLFTENKQITGLLLHGSYSHRIMFEVIRCAIKNGKLDLKYGDGKELNLNQLLELLVYTTFSFESEISHYLGKITESLWGLTIDTVRDSRVESHNNGFLNPDYYSYSCCSPLVLNSLLLCFGNELGLPHLQSYLLDSHYKASYEMVFKVKNASPSSRSIPDSTIYEYCMQAFSVAYEPGKIGFLLPFTLTQEETLQDPSYVRFDSKNGIPGVVKKIKKFSNTSEYRSWPDFFHRFNQQTIFPEKTKKSFDSQLKEQVNELHQLVLTNHDRRNDQKIADLVKMNPSQINSLDFYGRTPLFALIDDWIKIDLDFIEYLIELGAKLDIACPSAYGYENEYLSLLHLAAYRDEVELAKFLLKPNCGFDINEQTNWARNTPLIIATVKHRTEMIKFLIENNSDISLRDRLGRSAQDFLIPRSICYKAEILKIFEEALNMKNTSRMTMS